MDDTRFDAWTRRTFGKAVGGGLASLISLGPFTAVGTRARTVTAQAKKKKRRVRCLNLKHSCNPDTDQKRERCCARLRCGELADRDGNHCCRPIRTTCRHGGECCGDLQCDNTIDSGRKRCCVAGGGFCQRDQDCCRGGRCDTFRRTCV